MNDILVSIIIPVYKTEQFLDECLNSMIGQDYPALEIILEDDGSPGIVSYAGCPLRSPGYRPKY